MIKKTYFKKSNTIIRGSEENFGLNPISMLHCGGMTSRFIVYFDINSIKKYIYENQSSTENFTHRLHMTNCGSIDNKHFNDEISGFNGSSERRRNTSFDVVIFEVPQEWDAGIGFDSSLDYWLTGNSSVSYKGSTWYNSTTDNTWGCNGIYSDSTLNDEISKYKNNDDSIIVSIQHFDYGNEDLDVDITKYVNDVVNAKKRNHGLCISYAPCVDDTNVYYTGFFNNNTNTFFEPYVETSCKDAIHDDRYKFYLDKENNLLLFAQIDGEFVNLDENPICTIDGMGYPVKRVKKGVYCASVKLSSKQYDSDTILTDVWTNIKLNDEVLDDVEMDFVTLKKQLHFNIGTSKDFTNKYTAIAQGINHSETLHPDEKRDVKVYFKRDYTHNDYKLVDDAKYRVYTTDGKREIDVIDWDNIDVFSDYNVFTISSNDFLPGDYKIDIKAKIGNDTRVYKEVACFNIKNNTTKEKY